MDDYNAVYAFLVLVMFIILLSRLDSRFGKIEKELNEIKKRMDEYLKAQQKAVVDKTEPEEVLSAKVVDETPDLPQTVEEMPVSEIYPQEAVVEEKQEAFAPETVIADETTLNRIESPEENTKVRAEQPAAPKPKQKVNYEKFIGENLFGKIGILIFVIGVGFFVKYAIDKDWINETFRTVLGFLTGVALLIVAERLQKKYRTFSSLLAGGAFAVFYLTVAIAFHYYHIFSQTAAFIILIVVTVFMSVLSVIYDRRELAIIALIGGFLAPFIVSSGEGSYLVLFTYVSILNLGMFGLSIYRKWSELPIISFVFTCLILGIFILMNYTSDSTIVSTHMFLLASLSYFIFLLPVFSILRGEKTQTMSRGLVFVIIANNFVYLFSGALFLRNMGLSFKASGLLSLFIALVNLGLVLWLWKNRKDYKFLVHTTLGLVLTFVSITIPIQLDGNYITLLWASEMVLLLWLYIKSKIRVYEYAAKILIGFTFASYLIDVYKVVFDNASSGAIFLNSSFATSLFVGLAAGAFALIMERYRTFFQTARHLKYTPYNAIMLFASVITLYYTFMMEFALHFEGAVRSGAMLLFTSVSIALTCFAFGKRFPIKKHIPSYLLVTGVNVLIYLINIWYGQWKEMALCPALLRWLAAVAIIANLYYLARWYYTFIGSKPGFTVYLNILATLLWVTMVRSFLWQVGVEDFSAGLSLALSAAGFVQMGLGMRLHQKALRMISLSTFGIVLLKLVVVDLWAMAAIGKIVVFIILGLILLILSFLYQKLKDVLFKNDEEEER